MISMENHENFMVSELLKRYNVSSNEVLSITLEMHKKNIENLINIYRWDVRKCEGTVSLRIENICITSCYVKNVQIPFSFWSLFHRNHKQDIQAVTVLIRNERRQLKGDEAFSQ